MKIAAAQLTCAPADIPANIRKLVALTEQARDQGAELILFPELALTGYEIERLAADRRLWVDADDARLDALRTSGIVTVVNAALDTDGSRPAIGTLVFAADGALITVYWKQHLYEQEQGVFVAGERDGRFEFGGRRFALATCYDNHFPNLTARGAVDGCFAHLASSLHGTGNGATERATIYPEIARGSNLHVVLANHVGPSGPWVGCGGAAVWAPSGALLAEADDRTTTVVIADIGSEP